MLALFEQKLSQMTTCSPTARVTVVFWLDVSFLPGYLSRRLDCLTLIIVNMGITFYRVTVQRGVTSRFPVVLSLPDQWCGGQGHNVLFKNRC